MKSPKRMKDVARIAGVSPATVSRVMHSPELVTEKTRRTVEEAMLKIGYIYNSVAADFTRQQNSMIGLIIFTVRSSIHAELIEGIQDELAGTRFSLIIANSKYEAETEKSLIKLFRERKLAGVIVAEATDANKPELKALHMSGVPVVVTWEMTSDPSFNCVGIDNLAASRQMVRYIMSQGHRRIGLIIGNYKRIERVRQRYDGYAEALKSGNIPLDKNLIISSVPSPQNGEDAMSRLLTLEERPTAVFAASDAFALGAITAAKERGYRVPEDISICGFDDDDFARYCDPPLTTVKVPGYDMGKYSARTILDYHGSDTTQITRLCLPTELTIRRSST